MKQTAKAHTVTEAQWAQLQKMEQVEKAAKLAGEVGIQEFAIVSREGVEGVHDITMKITMVDNVSQGLRKKGPNWGLPYGVVETQHFTIGNTAYGIFLNIGPNRGKEAVSLLTVEAQENWLARATAIQEASGVTPPA